MCQVVSLADYRHRQTEARAPIPQPDPATHAAVKAHLDAAAKAAAERAARQADERRRQNELLRRSLRGR